MKIEWVSFAHRNSQYESREHSGNQCRVNRVFEPRRLVRVAFCLIHGEEIW